MKKKVRYAAGDLGALGVMPALGLVTPAAATAATQAPARTGKSVSLAPLATANTCPGDAHQVSSGTNFDSFLGSISYSIDNGCIGRVHGALSLTSTHWWLRVRAYATPGGKPTKSYYNKNGHIKGPIMDPTSISWTSNPHIPGIKQICEAAVKSGNPAKGIFGPVCESTYYKG